MTYLFGAVLGPTRPNELHAERRLERGEKRRMQQVREDALDPSSRGHELTANVCD